LDWGQVNRQGGYRRQGEGIYLRGDMIACIVNVGSEKSLRYVNTKITFELRADMIN
jgi:hypothetical protein